MSVIGSIIKALENERTTSINLSMDEERVGTLNIVGFCVSDGEKKYRAPISAPTNDRYDLTGDERVPYQKIWDDLRGILAPSPFPVLGPELKRDYSVNIPNALHLLDGWFQNLHSLEEQIREKGLSVAIERVGSQRYNERLLRQLGEIVTDQYQGYLLQDATVKVRER